MNPFELERRADKDTLLFTWKDLAVKPYNKAEVDPYTKCRIILMNGIEVEAVMFGHNFNRNCPDNDLRREIALTRALEQSQQKRVNWLSPSDETPLELTIGYEQLAVDLTAWLAIHEPDSYAKSCMDFALLEDFDHLYRYSNLMKLNENIPAESLVMATIEITPGRPTISHHRHPFDAVRKPGDVKKHDIRTTLGALILTAGEQQTMNFYMNIGNQMEEGPGRDLYQEIAMVEEDHVTHYGDLLDPKGTWLENMLLREYMETYVYYSFLETETDPAVKKIWERHFDQEVAHLHKAADLLKSYEGTEWSQMIPDGKYPDLLDLHPQKDYVRSILAEQVELTAQEEKFVDVNELPDDYRFFAWNKHVNGNAEDVPSHVVIQKMQGVDGRDYRFEDKESPVPELRDRSEDNTELGR
ncbi:hypothetical protein Corgl_1432 [Coriobacterium glomerans PW2]|uniref:Ferritin-like domain-containing protein n=1 Tax=Coriobacterium glomerans (strain ATCC 49209 / DSM 20642 / JCM 10262 / PW2) TaxID=700015 RepID=F2NAS6_CORGP|nr:hypothetical protein [Coriobacterium glomerans]AEB07532.1 hypothetical protein Corgl_1432 [Coriobacterium glomerans PW2]